MLTRLFIDNFRTFNKFEVSFPPLTLLVGRNGSGKTAIFDVLEKLRRLITETRPCPLTFFGRDLPAWGDNSGGAGSTTTVTMELNFDGCSYRYELRLCVSALEGTSWIDVESLKRDGQLVAEYTQGVARVYDNEGKETATRGWSRDKSVVGFLSSFTSAPEVRQFGEWFEKLRIVAPNPGLASRSAADETDYPDRALANFAGWVRHLSQESPTVFQAISNGLREILPDFRDWRLERSGEARILKFDFQRNATWSLGLDQLSDGQRQLVMLYTLLEACVRTGQTVAIDEPENYLALREVQPWLRALEDAIEERGGQCILASHHPEVLNYLPYESFRLLSRDDQGRSRVVPFSSECISDKLLTPAEVMARGWEEP